jgi:hypothetical protein
VFKELPKYIQDELESEFNIIFNDNVKESERVETVMVPRETAQERSKGKQVLRDVPKPARLPPNEGTSAALQTPEEEASCLSQVSSQALRDNEVSDLISIDIHDYY